VCARCVQAALFASDPAVRLEFARSGLADADALRQLSGDPVMEVSLAAQQALAAAGPLPPRQGPQTDGPEWDDWDAGTPQQPQAMPVQQPAMPVQQPEPLDDEWE